MAVDIQTQPRFPVVGLGASAGGLEALTSFFEALPPQTGMAFVVIQHLSPHQKSILHELLQRHSRLPVHPITDDLLVQPDQVYVLPSGYELVIARDHLHLLQQSEATGWPQTISRFFESLALDRGSRAAVIVFSGAGHDGTEGAQVIHTQGGLVIAQDPKSASQSSMPASLIESGVAHAVLPPNQMSNYLVNHFGISLPPPLAFEDLTVVLSDPDLTSVVQVLFARTGFNFSDYKQSTLRRQIARRMGVRQIGTVSEYLGLLNQQPQEVNNLVNGLLIHVTSFFRDPEAFDSLKTNALLPLLGTLSIDHVFRVWVPGCASGEEAVSVAILIHESLRELNLPEMEVRIFATDMNRELIQRTREGFYPASIADSVSPARLRDHFITLENGYQVRSHISRMIVWAEHNLIEHPPFSSLHLISCRNVMIYFQPRLQEKIRALFQFSLLPGGILFLGTSEAIPDLSDMFSVIDSKQKIFRRTSRAADQWMRFDRPVFAKIPVLTEEPVMNPSRPSQTGGDDQKLTAIKETLLAYYNATCAIVDENYTVRYTYGEIDQYLRLVPGGEVQTSILSMAREGLNSELTIALYEAFESNRTITRSDIRVQTNGDSRLINLIVKPVQESILGNHYRLVIFERSGTEDQDKDAAQSPEDAETVIVQHLRTELQQARQALQSATQALQAKSEELISSMEEISSANEEVQTTNEELRTSKEELESMNEELNTLNSQLVNQNHELTHANNTLYNFLQSTANGVIFLDQNLAIREYTQAATALFSLRKTDVGRPLSEITSQLAYDSLIEDANHVLDTLANVEGEISALDGRWYKMDIRPYRTLNNAIDGLVLTFTDISLQKLALKTAELTTDYVRDVVETVENGLLELDGNLRVLIANSAFYDQFQVTEAETVGKLLYDLGSGQWDIPELRHLLTEIIPQQTFVRNYEVTHDFPGIGRRTMRLNARRIHDVDRILLVITDLGSA